MPLAALDPVVNCLASGADPVEITNTVENTNELYVCDGSLSVSDHVTRDAVVRFNKQQAGRERTMPVTFKFGRSVEKTPNVYMIPWSFVNGDLEYELSTVLFSDLEKARLHTNAYTTFLDHAIVFSGDQYTLVVCFNAMVFRYKPKNRGAVYPTSYYDW